MLLYYIPKNSQKQFQEQLRLLLWLYDYIPFMKLLDWYHYYLGNLVKQFPSLSICAPAHNTHSHTKGRYTNRTCVVHGIIPFKDVYFFTALTSYSDRIHKSTDDTHATLSMAKIELLYLVGEWLETWQNIATQELTFRLFYSAWHTSHNQEMHIKNIAYIQNKNLW